ncbi:MAG: PEP-CTERM sorting domain-containing protein [Candidatus Acidiferrales bacterium]
MRKTSWVLALLWVAAFAQPAFADTYTITLYDSSNPTRVDGTGTFTYNGTSFTSFTVTWDGTTFDLESVANAGNNFGCAHGGAAATFTFLTNHSCEASLKKGFGWKAASIPGKFTFFSTGPGELVDISHSSGSAKVFGFSQDGQFTVVDTSVLPEPSTVTLTLLGIGFVTVMRKRKGQGILQAR